MVQGKRKPTISLRLPPELLRQVDEFVHRTGMRSRTEFVERALEEYVEELREAKVIRIKPYTGEEAREAILVYLGDHPGTYVSDLADSLAMDIELAFRVVHSLAEEGEVVA
ncbi:MAG: ribbon-helix-helix domain-containing protein [Thermoplasmata archaeon]